MKRFVGRLFCCLVLACAAESNRSQPEQFHDPGASLAGENAAPDDGAFAT
jgi:hypothetical protein